MDLHHEKPTWENLGAVREKGLLTEGNPDIIAIFQQIRNLREGERSIRSLRRSLTLDNMPVLDVAEADDEGMPSPEEELDQLLDRFLQVKRAKEDVERRFRDLLVKFTQLQEISRQQAEELEALRRSLGSRAS